METERERGRKEGIGRYEGMMDGERGRTKEGWMEGGRDGRRERWKEVGMDGGRHGRVGGGRERGREIEREREREKEIKRTEEGRVFSAI